MDETSTTELYRELRPLLFSIAYRMIGSVTEAEDVVQEAFLRYHRARSEGVDVQSPRAFLSTVTTRLSIDALRSARVRRESYVGEWIPEPLLTGASAADPAALAEDADSLSMASCCCSSGCRRSSGRPSCCATSSATASRRSRRSSARANPTAASWFLGRVGTSPTAGRGSRPPAPPGTSSRAGSSPPSATGTWTSWSACWRPTSSCTATAADGRLPGPRPIVGQDNFSRLMYGLGEQMRQVNVVIRPIEVNGQPGALVLDPDGHLVNVFSLDIADGAVQVIRSVINPDKLRHLGPLADLCALMTQRARR